jgi:sugar/nucleoside kinase (ribokinase family)
MADIGIDRPMGPGGAPRCAVVGDIAVDVHVRADERLTRGADARGQVSAVPGGAGANVAVWMSRCGAAATCIGVTGRDPWGQWLRADLRRERVQIVGPRRGRTASIVVLVDAAGERTFVTDRAAALDLRGHDVPSTLWDGLALLHVSGYALFEGAVAGATAALAAEARRRGVAVSLDLASASLLRAYGADAFASVVRALAPDVLFGNEDEAAVFARDGGPSALIGVLASMAPTAVLKRGAAGAVAVTAGITYEAAAPSVPVVDTTGAGDALAAAFLVERMRGAAVPAALRVGVAVGSAVVGAVGARPHVEY